MSLYRVVQDINNGQYPVGSEIELTDDEAAAIPWAIEPASEDAIAQEEGDLVDGNEDLPQEGDTTEDPEGLIENVAQEADREEEPPVEEEPRAKAGRKGRGRK